LVAVELLKSPQFRVIVDKTGFSSFKFTAKRLLHDGVESQTMKANNSKWKRKNSAEMQKVWGVAFSSGIPP